MDPAAENHLHQIDPTSMDLREIIDLQSYGKSSTRPELSGRSQVCCRHTLTIATDGSPDAPLRVPGGTSRRKSSGE
jgi:hypothetical protein